MMIFRDLRVLFAAAVLVCLTAPAGADQAFDSSKYPECPKPRYPRDALRRLEEGVSKVGFLIRADGTVGRAVVLSSSGYDDLDEAAAEALSKCVFKPATVDGKAVEEWVPVRYVWAIDDDLELRRARHDAATAAIKGDVGARYRLSLILSMNAKTDVEREHALTVLRSAADLGLAQAQYDLGSHYEKGSDVKADIEEAMRWYQKAAAQGDVLAVQRLRIGPTPDSLIKSGS